jgi:hypothetical protein
MAAALLGKLLLLLVMVMMVRAPGHWPTRHSMLTLGLLQSMPGFCQQGIS